MKRSSYGERDYAFGQLMLTLRTRIGLTQDGLAQRLRISRHSVGEWEGGLSYPKAEHLKQFIALGVRASAFRAGHEEEEIRALWRAGHQKVLLDEPWLQELLRKPATPGVEGAVEQPPGADRVNAPADVTCWINPHSTDNSALSREPRVDWGEALDVPSFYGREGELALLSRWVGEQRCRVVSVLGLGGIGKSALAVSLMHQVAEQCQVVLWRSLRDAPSCEALLESCLQVLAPEALARLSPGLEPRLNLLLSELRELRVLLVLDNLEGLLQAGEVRGDLRGGYEGYGRLLEQVAQTRHSSCLLLTSREKPVALRALEGRLVRSLRLSGLAAAACEQLLAEHELLGSQEERARLVERYEGNPLALHIVAQTIADLFGGEISPFLEADTTIFGGIAQLLSEHWGRLSPLEQTLLYWLAILREPVTLEELQAVLVAPLAPVQLLEAVDGLHRCSLVERGQHPGSFTLQSVVLEYVTDRLVTTASQEIEQGRLRLLCEQSLSQAQAKEYVRQTQERLLLTPLLDLLLSVYRGRAEVEERLRKLLSEVRSWAQGRQGYGPANLVTLLRLLRGDLRGLDLSQLALRGVYLQGVEMQDATLSGTLMRECVWTESFDAITAVAISPSGQYWAAAGRRGKVWVWREEGQRLHLAWRAHTHIMRPIAFSQDERLLASGSWDGTLKLWDLESGALRWSSWHPHSIHSLAFAPDGSLLASSGRGATVRLWDPKLGTPLQDLPHPGAVLALAWSPDGRLLASGDVAGTIRLWERQPTRPARCVQTLSGHTNLVSRLAFAPDGRTLASASWDGTVKLWEWGEEGSLRLRQRLLGHTERVQALDWSPDGATLASGSFDRTIRLWDGQEGRSRLVLQGHTAVVNSLAFTPDSRHLLSSSEDGMLRLWDVQRGEALRVLQGYETCLYDLDWSPDGTQLASAGADRVVSLWQVESLGGGTPRGVLRSHEWCVYGVGWRPDGSLLASSGWDNAIRLWEPATGSCLEVIRDPDHSDNVFGGVAWSPDGKLLASATLIHGVLLWEVTAGSLRWIGREQPIWSPRLAWSPEGTCLVAGGNDGHVYVWDALDGTLLRRLAGHDGPVWSVVWSPDGRRLASGGGGREGGELFVWDAHSGKRMQALTEHPGVASAVAWSPSGGMLISGGSDGMLRWWEIDSGHCVRVREAHQGTVQALKVSPDGSRLASCGDDGAIVLWDLERGEHVRTLRRDRPYERLNITGIRGLSDAQKASLLALGAFEETSVGG